MIVNFRLSFLLWNFLYDFIRREDFRLLITGVCSSGGACGYGNPFTQGYGSNTAALSHVLYNNGLTCGACFELQCVRSQNQYCYGGGNTVTVTATNYCPQGSNGAWCDNPNVHFDLAYAALTQLAPAVAGVFPVQYKRWAHFRLARSGVCMRRDIFAPKDISQFVSIGLPFIVFVLFTIEWHA